MPASQADSLMIEAADLLEEARRERDQARAEAAALRVELRLAQTTPASLLERLDLRGLADGDRLRVMAQNPANNHYWSRSLGGFTTGEVRAALQAEPR